MVIRADGRILELEREAGRKEPEVPQDRLLPPVRRFRKPGREEIERSFALAHSLSEICYMGGGYWDDFGDHWRCPVRSTSDRVIGYIRGYHTLGDEIYRTRAIEGLEYLLNEQRPDGSYAWYYRSHKGVCNRWDGLFDTGIAGHAFVEAYHLFRDERYLEASERTAQWEKESPISPNNNYNMFAVWHLAAHYKLTGDESCLESAIDKTREGGFPRQLPSGGWPEHNSWIWYHGIIVRGMVELYLALPGSHAFRHELFGPMTAAINRAIREQRATGEIAPNPGIRRSGHTCPFIAEALIMANPVYRAELDHVVSGIMRYRLRKERIPDIVDHFRAKWTKHQAACAESKANASGEVVWQADLTRYRTDADWGDMVEGAFNCWYHGHDPVPGEIRWSRSSEGQRITVGNREFLGGMGFRVPSGVLTPGRRYMLHTQARAEVTPGAADSIDLFLASASEEPDHAAWDPFGGCEFSRENAAYSEFSEVSIPFTASHDGTCAYFWIMTKRIPSGERVSIILNEMKITDFGLPIPRWRSPVRDGEPHLALEVNGACLETIT